MFWRGVVGYLPVQVVQAVAGFGAIVVFTRLLSPADYGAYALAFSVATLVQTCLFTWAEAAVARFHAAEDGAAGRAALHGTLRRAFVALAFVVPAAVAAVVLALPLEPRVRWAVGAGVAAMTTRSALKLVQERRRAAGEVKSFALYDMLQTGGAFLLGAGLAAAGAGGAAPLLGVGGASLILLAFALPGELKAAPGAGFDRRRLAAAAAYGLPLSLSLVMALALATTDRFVLAAFRDEAAVGAYHAGYSLSNRTLDVMFAWLGMAGGPAAVAAFERGGLDALRRSAREQAELMAILALPAAAGLALVARPLAELMVGPELREGAAGVTPWVALGGLCSGATTYYLHTAFTLGKRTGAAVAGHGDPRGREPGAVPLADPALRTAGRGLGDGGRLRARPVGLRRAGPRRGGAADPVDHARTLRAGHGGDDGGRAARPAARRRPRTGRQGGGRLRRLRRRRAGPGRGERAHARPGAAPYTTRGARRMSPLPTPNAAWAAAAPRLSVLTPFFREDPRTLLGALAREAAGLDGAVELVLLDDAGGDPARSQAAAEALAASQVPATLIATGVNEGRAKARNRLAAAARARHLLFLDADMLPDAPDFLQRWLALADAGDAPAAFGGFSLDQARPGVEHRLHHALQSDAECLPAAMRSRNPAKHVFTSNLLVRRDVLAAEPFDEAFSGWGWEDVEWGARVAARFGVTHIDNPASHLGLDTAAALAAKYEQSPPNFARLLARHPDLVRGFASYRAARLLGRLPARAPLRRGLKAVALAERAPLRARTAAMRLYKAALYAEVVR